MEPVQRTLEVERIVNLIRGFGWDKKSEQVDGDVIRLSIEKKIESPVSSESQS